MDTIKMRPHHLLDIVTNFQRDDDPDYEREPGENGVRTVVRMVGRDLDFGIELVVGPDFICEPCSHLQPNGRCERILDRHDPPQAMDDYNDPLDERILGYLGLAAGTVMTAREYLGRVNARLPGIEEVCTHATSRKEDRRDGLVRGMETLGLRPAGA